MTNGDYSQLPLKKFREALRDQNYLILDTETTGLADGEIVQIAIMSRKREVLLDAMVKPSNGIPKEAQMIHGITPEMVENALPWREVAPLVQNIIKDQPVVVYNAAYDRRMLYTSTEYAGMDRIDWFYSSRWYCAMISFAELYGDWNDYHRDYRWQRLGVAAAHMGVSVENAHSALGDVIMTAGVVEKMLNGDEPEGVNYVEEIPW